MNRLFASLLLLGCASLGACATGGGAATPGAGYSAEMVSPNRYRVIYAAPKPTDEAVIADRALSHAAQVTLDNGNEWFEIASRIKADQKLTLVIVMGKGETLAGGSAKTYDAKKTLADLKAKARTS